MVDFEITSDSARVLRSIDQVGQRLDRIEQQQRRGNQTRREGAAITRQEVASFAAKLGAVQAINQELERQKRLQREAAQAVQTTAQAEAGLIRNLGAVSTEERDRALRFSRGLTSRGLTPAEAATITGAAVSGGGGASFGGVIAPTVDLAARFTPGDADATRALAGGALDVSKATGTQDPLTNIGLILAAGGLARPEETADLVRGFSPALLSFTQAGGSATQGAALGDTLSRLGGETTGRETGTALTNLAFGLREFGQGRGFETTDPISVLQAIQADPQLQQQFLGEVSTRAQFKGAVESIVTGGRGADELQSSLDAIGQLSSADFASTVLRNIEGESTQVVAGELAVATAEQELQRATNLRGAGVETIRRRLRTVEDDEGRTFGQFLRDQTGIDLFDPFEQEITLGRDPVSAGISALETRTDRGPEAERLLSDLKEELRQIRGNQETGQTGIIESPESVR